MNPPVQLLIKNTPSTQLLSKLEKVLSVQMDAQQQVTKRYFDSFDWRLYKKGMLLELLEINGTRQLNLLDLATDELRQTVTLGDQMPGFAWDLPDGALKDAVSPMLAMRLLLPVIDTKGRLKHFRVFNKDEKTVVRGVLEEAGELGNGDDSIAYIRLMAVRGYDKSLLRTQAILENKLGAKRITDSVVQQTLSNAARPAGEYSSKLDFSLAPDTRSDLVVKGIHQYILNVLTANIEGTQEDLDSEFLHDLRVATRRIRSALTQVKGIYEPELVEKYKTEFAWIQKITGPTRDMDVYLLKFDVYRDSLPAWVRPDLSPFHDFLVERQASEQKALATALASDRFQQIMTNWQGFLDEPVPERSFLPHAIRPIRWVASERIWKMYRRVLTEGLAITSDSPAEALHELRKNCKKLRYLMEFFQSLYSGKKFRQLLSTLKMLLDNLGDFQDFEVQAHALRGFGEEMDAAGQSSADTLIAMGMLVGGLMEGQQNAHEAFAGRFAEFATEQNQQAFRTLFKPVSRES